MAEQPSPLTVILIKLTHRGEPLSVLTRTWDRDDVARCRLCADGCGASGQTCTIVVPGTIADEDSRLFACDRNEATPARGGESRVAVGESFPRLAAMVG